ncbi:unnamed protein product [Amoebophrya sp. A25]|nr:unnamed protein product [Amoebophrya sp. A25]|eukprot:GSA25T00004188001.1
MQLKDEHRRALSRCKEAPTSSSSPDHHHHHHRDPLQLLPPESSQAVVESSSSSLISTSVADILQQQCPLCFDEYPKGEMISLDEEGNNNCPYRFCSDCFVALLSSKITDGLVQDDELLCPMPNCCKSPISTTLIEQELRLKSRESVEETERNQLLWDKFLSFRLKLFRPKTGKIARCRVCDLQVIVDMEEAAMKCASCGTESCPSCGEEPHPQFPSCEAFRRWREANSEGDKRLEDLLTQENWCRCPVCGVPVEREAGCNFMQCPSPVCRNKTYFCYVCGQKVEKENHYAHYQKGPYEDYCIVRPEGVKGKKAVYVPASEQDLNAHHAAQQQNNYGNQGDQQQERGDGDQQQAALVPNFFGRWFGRREKDDEMIVDAGNVRVAAGGGGPVNNGRNAGRVVDQRRQAHQEQDPGWLDWLQAEGDKLTGQGYRGYDF